MARNKLLNIYLSPAPAPNKGKYKLFRDGKDTGELITNTEIRSLLSREQYQAFVKGDDIFYVPADKYRTRCHKKSSPGAKSINPKLK
jgi:hypothetical protein